MTVEFRTEEPFIGGGIEEISQFFLDCSDEYQLIASHSYINASVYMAFRHESVGG